MRLCTTASSGFEDLFTTVGSEPLLAEAATVAMTKNKKRLIQHLSTCMDSNCINLGERGELVAALLVMQARDAVASENDRRWVYVCEFLKKLLGNHAFLQELPRYNHKGAKEPLQKNFKRARMWFNHVLKIRNMDLINVRHLWKFITRGAMILCANNQRGVDMILPVCFSGKTLSRHTVTAILVQVKNDTSFGENVHSYLFDAMEPFKIDLFDEGTEPLPIIRMVFALASKTSAVKNVLSARTSPRLARNPAPDAFTSYDIWCAGVDRKTFPLIGDDLSAYQQLLNRARFPGQEDDISRVHDVVYPDEIERKKVALLHSFDPLLEYGVEHQSHYIERPPADSEIEEVKVPVADSGIGQIAAPAKDSKAKGKQKVSPPQRRRVHLLIDVS
jgi:hypothetical protein